MYNFHPNCDLFLVTSYYITVQVLENKVWLHIIGANETKSAQVFPKHQIGQRSMYLSNPNYLNTMLEFIQRPCSKLCTVIHLDSQFWLDWNVCFRCGFFLNCDLEFLSIVFHL